MGSPAGGRDRGALLRLRPKVMTVSTVVAGLLPIMWSHSTGAEVMKPLATPVLAGDGQLPDACAAGHPGDLLLAAERELRREERRRPWRQTAPSTGGRRSGRPMDTCPNHDREEKHLMKRVCWRCAGDGLGRRAAPWERLGSRSER